MSIISVSGVSESRVAPFVKEYSSTKDQCIVVCSNYERAKELSLDLSFFVKEKEIVLLSESDSFLLNYDAKNRDELNSRLKGLKKLRNKEHVIVICPVSTFVHKLAPHKYFEESILKLENGSEYRLNELKDKLFLLGYERVNIIENKGEFSIRGGIFDIFPPDYDNPIRIEFFGDEIDSIRSFNIITQLSIEKLDSITLYPAQEITISKDIFTSAITKIKKEYDKEIKKSTDELKDVLLDNKDKLVECICELKNLQLVENYLHYFFNEKEYIWEYMDDGILMFDEIEKIYDELRKIDLEQESDFNYLLKKGEVIKFDKAMLSGTSDFLKALSYPEIRLFSPFVKKIKGIDRYDELKTVKARETLKYNGNMNSFLGDINNFLKKGYEINVVCESKERIKNITDFLLDEDVHGNINFLEGKISSGIDYVDEKKVWISEDDIFVNKKKKKQINKFSDDSSKIRRFTDIKEGDYIVHINHGIGKFEGIIQMTFDGEKKDYIKIKYAGSDVLYVPVENLDLVQKYIGSGNEPKVNRLSSSEWQKTKERTKKEILLMAQDLIDLYAKRSNEKGFQFGRDTVWQSEFEDAFPYQETDDQVKAIYEIKEDMEKPIPMDRLLLGDVGFGKTEVAARAAFKCLAEGKQVAFLVPTTILANQHYYTLKDRFEHFPFKVEVLSRFKSKGQQDKIVENLKNGSVDMVIGTHRLLSKDIMFKDLGLLIIDEEQRFGVEAKENLKKLKTNVDCLTLTATPIPRTLNMSLNGIKDMSLLENPPVDRYPVQTYVLEQDDVVIKDAIERELNRGGQVYVVFNRVSGISNIANKISQLVPSANVIYGHGKMNEEQLENVMLSFINHEADVLVSTTIVESGLDIPNANTMIILDSERYGLSELYQLRGRVGRTNRVAYCYLMHEPNKVLTEIAEKRLNAIREFTEFGSGFKIAIRDLEIRGAGNLLGEAQSGHMSSVGYELYVKMIDNAVRALKGEIVDDREKEAHIEIPISAFIPNSYIDDELVRMDIYKKIAAIKNFKDQSDVIDELIDRFGDVPKETLNLIKISHIRHMCEILGISKVNKQDDGLGNTIIKSNDIKIKFNFEQDNKLNAFSLYNLNANLEGYVFMHLGPKPYIVLSTNKNEMLDKSLEMLYILVENVKSVI